VQTLRWRSSAIKQVSGHQPSMEQPLTFWFSPP
jgi:hypothetical protein